MNPDVSTPHPIFALTRPWVIFGAILYPLGRFTDIHFNLPLTDLLIPLIILFHYTHQPAPKTILSQPGIWPAAAFILWTLLANTVHSVPAFNQLRTTVALGTIFVPVFAFAALTNRTATLQLILGCLVGFGIDFGLAAFPQLISGYLDRELRGLQPTPIVALAFAAAFKKQLSPFAMAALLGIAAFSTAIAIGIQSRGPLISIAAAIPLYVAIRMLRPPPVLIALVLITAVAAHWIIPQVSENLYDTVLTSDNNTLSNRERAALIEYSVEMISQNPIFGISQSTMIYDFADYFALLDKFRRDSDAVHSPHNTFLEYATFYGLPAAVLFCLFLFRTIRPALATVTNPWVTAAVIAGLIRLMAFYGLSGWLRIEWVALMFILIAHAKATRQTTPSQPLTR